MKVSFISNFDTGGEYQLKKKHVFLFISALVLTFIGFEAINRSLIVRTSSSNYLILNSFNQKKNDIEVLFIGDSHFAVGLDAEEISSRAFNLSFGEAHYIQAYYLLNYYIDELPALKAVVVPLDLMSFSSFKTDIFNETFFWNQFIDYGELAKIKGYGVFLKKFTFLTILDETLGGTFFADNMKQLMRKALSNREHQKQEEVKFTKQSFPSSNDKAYRMVKRHFYNQNIFDPDLMLYFDKILKLCKENDILLVTLQMPASKEYLTYAAEYIDNDEFRSKIFNKPFYRKGIYKNFDYLDFFVEKPQFFSGDNDGYHLNLKGRETFSKVIAKEINEL